MSKGRHVFMFRDEGPEMEIRIMLSLKSAGDNQISEGVPLVD